MGRKQDHSESEHVETDDEMDVDQEDLQPSRKRGRPPKKIKQEEDEKSLPPEEEDEGSDSEVDEVGEEKVNQNGYLLGGREYRFQTFTLAKGPDLYLFSLDASKLLGFRDTYIFFLRNPKIKRYNGTEQDREYLKTMRLLPSQLRTRPITLIKARNLFKVFGHKVIRRGRPVRDDYFCKGLEEPPFTEETRMDEDEVSFGVYDYQKSSLEGGPFRRHGISLLGYKNIAPDDAFEPLNVFHLEDNWTEKCMVSCAEFNMRLNRNRPLSFLDLHTNIEQIAKKTQPSRIRVQVKLDEEAKFKIDKEVVVENVDDPTWVDVGMADTTSNATLYEPKGVLASYGADPIRLAPEDEQLYPIALLRDQHQSQFSLYPYRFSDQDVPKQIPTRQEPFDLPPTLLGVQPFLPADAVVSKRARQKKLENGYNDTLEVCCHCHETEAPLEIQGLPNTMTLTCSKCATKHHPSCIEFSDKALIAKCLTYPWLCTNCKLCENCQKTGHDEQLLFCDVCDRGTHMFCLDPPLEKLPSGVWVCVKCSQCISCKKKNGKWCHVVQNGDFIATYCKDCYHEFINDRFCPFCLETFTQDDDVAMVCCDQCERWVHVDCEPKLDEQKYEALVEEEEPAFICTLCEEDELKAHLESRKDPYTKVIDYKGNTLIIPPLTK